jgi:tetratricopeptide (TPR) repeat protein
MRRIFLVLFTLLIVGCAPKGRIIEEPAAWTSKEVKINIRLDLVNVMIEGEQYDKALQMLSKLKSEGFKDPRIALMQGACLAAQGLFPEAEEALESARDSMKKSPLPHHELGILYADSGDIPAAINAFKEAVLLDEERATDWNNIGFLLFSEKKYVEASEALRTAVKTDPSKDKYRINLAFSLFGEKKHAEALRVFKSVLTNADAHYNMGVAHELSGDDTGAVEQYLMATKANPKHEAALAAQQRLKDTKEPLP